MVAGRVFQEYIMDLEENLLKHIPKERKRIKEEYKKQYYNKHLRKLAREEKQIKEKLNFLSLIDGKVPLVLVKGIYEHFSTVKRPKLFLNKELSSLWTELVAKFPFEVMVDYARWRVEKD